MADIIFSFNNGEQVLVLPYPPASNPIEGTQANEVFDGLNGKYTLIGTKDPVKFSFSGTLPTRQDPRIRPGSSSNGWDYVSFFEEAWDRKIPVRAIFIYSGYKLNIACLIDNFTWDVKKNGNIAYSISGTEYPFPLAIEKVPEKKDTSAAAEMGQGLDEQFKELGKGV